MNRVVVLGILASALMLASGPLSASHADDASDFLSIARHAIADPQTLSNVHALHAALTREALTDGFSDDRRGAIQREQIWLDPPSRLLDRIITGGSRTFILASGIDGARVMGSSGLPDVAAAREQRAKLRRYALAWLLFDPGALGVSLSDEGTSTINRRVVRVLHATDDVGFDLRLYFDPASHRLLMSDDATMTSHGSSTVVNGRAALALAPATLPESSVERITYGEYRRVDGIELPFVLSREIHGRLIDLWHVISYEVNPAKLDAAFKP